MNSLAAESKSSAIDGIGIKRSLRKGNLLSLENLFRIYLPLNLGSNL